MSLRTRIALTFLLLLTAVLTAALSAVSIANRRNAQHAVTQQIDSNSSLLTLAATAVAHDDGFHDAIAANDTETLVSALYNGGRRIGAELVVLTSPAGRVIAASGSRATAGSNFPIHELERNTQSGTVASNFMIDNGRLYQVVAVPVKAPLTIAWIAMGFELDDDVAAGLADGGGMGSYIRVNAGAQWRSMPTHDALQSLHGSRPTFAASGGGTEPATDVNDSVAKPTLGKWLAEAREPFDSLTVTLFWIAGVGVVGFGWAAFWISRSITQPLRDLTESVAHIRNGNYRVALAVQGRDELGVLAEGLQLMQTAVMSRDQSIRRLAYEDSLTGLMNRTAFIDSLGESLNSARGSPIGVAVVNLNRFRRINEHLGFSVGDAVLKNVASRLAAVPTITSAVARLSADRFAAYSRLADSAELPAWGASLIAALADPVIVEAQPIDINVTLGLVEDRTDTATADDMLRRADVALDQARREKHALAIYQSARNPAARDQLSLLGELRQAVERDELRLFFQPKIELASNRVAGAEVLLRWQHPTRGLLGPAAFIPFAEQTGFIRRITRWTLEHAITQCAVWHHAGDPLPLAVNISADDVADQGLDLRVARLLKRHQLPPSLLTLEVTESGFIEDPDRALKMLESLSTLGCNVSIDDFGTGYSSLSHLARMPAHEVKIDRSFVLGLESNPEYAPVVKSAIDMGHSLGLKVVAEGIETEADARRLKAFGCDIAQGYLYAKPMPLAALEGWLEGKQRVAVIALPAQFEIDESIETMNLNTY